MVIIHTIAEQSGMGRGNPFPWYPRSPDLNPLDLFLWGHLKRLVYSTSVDTREELLHSHEL